MVGKWTKDGGRSKTYDSNSGGSTMIGGRSVNFFFFKIHLVLLENITRLQKEKR